MNKKITSINDSELTNMQMLDQWFKELVYPGEVTDFFQEISGSGGPNEIIRKVCFYTEENQYFITAIERNGSDKHYLGCSVSSRKSRPGEDWIRGNDLPDGPFTKKTWDRIVYAIVSYEIVKLSPFLKPEETPE